MTAPRTAAGIDAAMARLRAERDQARRIAVELENEVAQLEAERDAAAAAAVRHALENAAKQQREFVLSDDFICDDWEAALTVVDLIDPAVGSPAREQGDLEQAKAGER